MAIFPDRQLMERLVQEKQANRTENLYPFWPSYRSVFERVGSFFKLFSDHYLDFNDRKQYWALKYHLPVYCITNTLSNLTVGYHIRIFLGLQRNNIAPVQTIMPAIVFSTLMGSAFHWVFILDKVITNPLKEPFIPMINSGMLQVGSAVLYPVVFTTFSSIYFAARYNTFPIPNDLFVHKETRQYIWKDICKKLMKRRWRSWTIIAMMNFCSTFILTYFESDEIRQIFIKEFKKHQKQNQQKQHQNKINQF